jgi:hypothetical protein
MTPGSTSRSAILATVLVTATFATLGQAADLSQDSAVRYLLATIQAFRTVYTSQVVTRLEKLGIDAREDWSKDDHAIMLPFQFVKMAAMEMKTQARNIDVGLVSLAPLYSANFPKTEAEVTALKTLIADPTLKVITFTDGKDFKGLAADFAIEQSCADCHNHHPNSHKHDYKRGDLMGAVVVRLRS